MACMQSLLMFKLCSRRVTACGCSLHVCMCIMIKLAVTHTSFVCVENLYMALLNMYNHAVCTVTKWFCTIIIIITCFSLSYSAVQSPSIWHHPISRGYWFFYQHHESTDLPAPFYRKQCLIPLFAPVNWSTETTENPWGKHSRLIFVE